MNIAFLASEVAPFAKSGGLADVSAALPAYLGRRGHDVRLFMPLYSTLNIPAETELVPVEYLHHLPVALGPHVHHFSVFTGKLPGSEVDVYFIGCPALYDRDRLYTGDWDDHLRFSFLTQAALKCCQHMGWAPDIVHCNDWHTALGPLYLKSTVAWDRGIFGNARSVLTIHNIAYQGWFSAETIGNLGLDGWAHMLHQEDLARGMVNFMRNGLMWADAITTVSRTYAKEIQTEAYGNGLEGLLRQRSSRVVGIVNGVDYSIWSPEVDPRLPRNYGVDDVEEGKAECRRYLLEQLKLPTEPEAPVLGIVSRLTAQKGFELIREGLGQALRYLNVKLAVLGSGEAGLEEYFLGLERQFPTKVCFYRGYSDELAHLIEAGSDLFIMPSRFEPCGLNQMYSLKYGTVPIVRKTGGLADTVQLFDRRTGEGNGIVFEHYDQAGFTWALRTALELYQDQEAWATMRRNGMLADYSWDRQGAEYEKLYGLLTR
ncbi:MAG: glycogen synthase GlgA [Acidobacteriota bacterium]